MYESQPAASTSSFIPVSVPPPSSLETPSGFKKRSTDLWLSLSSFPIHTWGDQEDAGNDNQSYDSRGSNSPRTPGLSWDSAPSSDASESHAQPMKSVFEDWEDPFIPSSSTYIEEDGTQTLLITQQSAFFHPPPTPRPFGYEPFSNGFTEEDLAKSKQIHFDDDFESSEEIPLTPKGPQHAETPKRPRGHVLFVDTTFPSLESEWSASILYSPKVADEATSWAPKGYVYGPDVPLDCIYSAGDVSPADRWDEKLWSPILRKNLRTAPCG